MKGLCCVVNFFLSFNISLEKVFINFIVLASYVRSSLQVNEQATMPRQTNILDISILLTVVLINKKVLN